MCFQTAKANSPSSVVSDPRLASHPPFSSSAESATAGTSSLPLLSQASSSSLLSSGLPNQPFQLASSPPLPGVARMQNMQTSQSNGSHPQWLCDSSSFSTSLPTATPGTMTDVASISGTTNSLQTPIISSQLHGSQTTSRIVGPSTVGSQSSALNTNPQSGPSSQPNTLPEMLPPPPPNVRPLGIPALNNFVPAAMPPYTVMSATSAPSPATIPFPPCSFTLPPPRPVVVSPPNSVNIPPSSVMECPSPGTFPVSTTSFSPATPLAGCTFSSPSPSSSNCTTITSGTAVVLRRPLTNGGNSNSTVDSVKVNGDSRHEPRKHFENHSIAADSRGDRRPFGGFRGSGDINRGGLRDPYGRERSGNRGLQQQLHSNGGRRYSSDNRNRMTRYRDYDDDRRSRRYEPSRDDFNRNRR